MPEPPLEPAEVARRAKAIYTERIQPLVTDEHHGKFIVVDAVSGEYEIAADHLEAAQRARALPFRPALCDADRA